MSNLVFLMRSDKMQPKTIGDRIQLLMLNNKISVQEICQLLEISRTTFYYWRAGVSEPESSKVGKMAKLFGVSCDYLILGDSSG